MKDTKFNWTGRLRAGALAILLLGCANLSVRADSFKDFKSNISQSALKPFAKDIGTLVGSNKAHLGRILGFPGFEVSIKASAIMKPDPDNAVLKSAGVKAFGLPYIQLDLGLPLQIDAFVRGISFSNFTMAGGGLRFSIFKFMDVPLAPQLLVAGMANSVSHDYFSATHFGADAVMSLNIPIIKPYMAVGVDRTRLRIKSANTASLVGLTASATEPRFTLGINLKPLPLVYLYGAYTRTHKVNAIDGGVSLRF
ncbi:MAG: hypothetical protein HY611_04650 [Elusimicrobia bacterium]|nr:hypothetical protein [Elusimicrobiota bacterium]